VWVAVKLCDPSLRHAIPDNLEMSQTPSMRASALQHNTIIAQILQPHKSFYIALSQTLLCSLLTTLFIHHSITPSCPPVSKILPTEATFFPQDCHHELPFRPELLGLAGFAFDYISRES